MQTKVFKYASLLILLAFAFMIGIQEIQEIDHWWMLLTGKWIAQNASIPKTDVFSFTHFGQEWINIKWLYELTIYHISKIGGAELVPLFQSVINVGISLLLIGISKEFYSFFPLNDKQKWPILYLISGITLFFCIYRMTARPEASSHLFLLVFIYCLLKADKNWKWFLPLIVVQVIWCNFHEAYGIGIVVSFLYLISKVSQSVIQKQKASFKNAAIFFLLILVACCVNPRTTDLLFHPFEIYGQLSSNKYTAELLGADHYYYWTNKESWAQMFYIGLAIIFILLYWKESTKENRHRIVFPLLLLLAFSYLSLSSYRNIVFVFLVSSPMAAALLVKLSKKKLLPFISITCLVILSILYVGTASRKAFTDSERINQYGLNLSSVLNPINSAQFLDSLNLSGNIFSDFQNSPYLLYHSWPQFKSYIDARDLDVFEASFFDEFNVAVSSETAFDELDKKYGFEAAVILRKSYPEFHSFMFNKPEWTPVYADNLNVIYIKGPTSISGLNESYSFNLRTTNQQSSVASFVSRVFNPFYQKNTSTQSALDAGNFYLDVQKVDGAFSWAEKAKTKMPYESHILKADAHLLNAILNKDSLHIIELKNALNSYKNARNINPSKKDSYLGEALVLLQDEKVEDAIALLKDLDRDPSVSGVLSQAYMYASKAGGVQSSIYLNLWKEEIEYILAENPLDEGARINLALYYCNNGNCDDAKRVLSLFNINKLDAQLKQNLSDCLKRCN